MCSQKSPRIPLKVLMKTFVFVLPYMLVELTNTLFVTIDKSLSNSLGTTAVIVFASFMSLNWAINTIQTCVSKAHSIVLARDRKNDKTINNTAMLIEVATSLLLAVLLFIFAESITYIFYLEDQTRAILALVLRLKAVQLPIYAIGLVPQKMLMIENKTSKIWVASVLASIINIGGDILSIKLGYNEAGIYVATIVSSLVNTSLLLIFARYRFAKIAMTYIKQILFFAKDLVFDKLVQRAVNFYYGHVASSFGTDIYAVHCVCCTVVDTMSEVLEGYYTGLLVEYSRDLENQYKNLLQKVDKIEFYGMLFASLLLPLLIYPLWLVLGNAVPWADCNPYIWLYALEFITIVAENGYKAYLAAAKKTQAIRYMALIGGACVRVPLCFLIAQCNIGLFGLALVCGIDRAVRTIYLRLYIKVKRTKLPL